MYKDLKLYANGCSYTWGGDLYKTIIDDYGLRDENNKGPVNLERLEVTWPNQLSRLLNASECYNLAMGSGSNDRILRKTFDFFLKVNVNDYKNYLVVIQWTDPSRFEFYDGVHDYWGLVKTDSVLTEKLIPLEKGLYDNIQSVYYWNHNQAFSEKLFTQIVALGNFLKSYDIKYFFTSMTSIYLKPEHLEYCAKNFNWFRNDILKCNITDSSIDMTSHPTVLGHKQIATNLYNFIIENNVLRSHSSTE